MGLVTPPPAYYDSTDIPHEEIITALDLLRDYAPTYRALAVIIARAKNQTITEIVNNRGLAK